VETSETSENILSQSSSEDAHSLKRQDAFTGKLTFALRTKTIDMKEIYKQTFKEEKL